MELAVTGRDQQALRWGCSGCYSHQGLHVVELSKQGWAVVADVRQGRSQNKTGLWF